MNFIKCFNKNDQLLNDQLWNDQLLNDQLLNRIEKTEKKINQVKQDYW